MYLKVCIPISNIHLNDQQKLWKQHSRRMVNDKQKAWMKTENNNFLHQLYYESHYYDLTVFSRNRRKWKSDLFVIVSLINILAKMSKNYITKNFIDSLHFWCQLGNADQNNSEYGHFSRSVNQAVSIYSQNIQNEMS